MLVLDSFVMLLPGLLGLLVPYITELVANSNVDPRVKSALNVVLSLLAGVLPTIAIVGGAAGLAPYLINVLVAWLLSGRMYLSKLVPNGTVSQDDLEKPVDTR